MNKRLGYLSVVLLLLSACQARSNKTSLSVQSSGVQSAQSTLSTNQLQFQSSHLTPVSVVDTAFQLHQSSTGLNYKIIPASEIQQMVESQLGASAFDQIQSAYQSYLTQPTGALPGILGQILFLKVPVASIVVTMNIKVIDLMSPYAAIITNGVTAFFGHAKLNALNANDFDESLFEITGESYFKRGSSLIILGGRSSKGLNRKISLIQFSMNRFTMVNVGTGLPAGTNLSSIAKFITSGLMQNIPALSGDQGKIILAIQDSLQKYSTFMVMDWNYTLTNRAISCEAMRTRFSPNLNCMPILPGPSGSSGNDWGGDASDQ